MMIMQIWVFLFVNGQNVREDVSDNRFPHVQACMDHLVSILQFLEHARQPSIDLVDRGARATATAAAQVSARHTALGHAAMVRMDDCH